MSESKLTFFFDSLVDTFQPTDNDLWAFSVYFGKNMDGLSINRSRTDYSAEILALNAGKTHALKKYVLRSDKPMCLIAYPSDLVLLQSGKAVECFGRATQMPAINFYPDTQNRIDMLQKVQKNGRVEGKLILSDIDANRFEGYVSCELITIDENTTFLLEQFKLVDVRDSLSL